MISSTRARTAATAIAATGWRTVVSGGSVNAMSGESSYPTTEMSPGTDSPRCRAARIAPSAIRSEPQTSPVTPRSMSRPAAASPPSTPNRDSSVSSVSSSSLMSVRRPIAAL